MSLRRHGGRLRRQDRQDLGDPVAGQGPVGGGRRQDLEEVGRSAAHGHDV
jgi:hypothetical protein